MKKSKNSAAARQAAKTQPPFFPVAQYTSIVGVHITLLVFTTLFLPRATPIRTNAHQNPAPSDRPSHPFLEPLTKDPLSTLIAICGGTVILQGWWAGWIRKWHLDFMLSGSARLKSSELKRKLIVRIVSQFLCALPHEDLVGSEKCLDGDPLCCVFRICYPDFIWRSTYEVRFFFFL
jgi:hypothetical protein